MGAVWGMVAGISIDEIAIEVADFNPVAIAHARSERETAIPELDQEGRYPPQPPRTPYQSEYYLNDGILMWVPGGIIEYVCYCPMPPEPPEPPEISLRLPMTKLAAFPVPVAGQFVPDIDLHRASDEQERNCYSNENLNLVPISRALPEYPSRPVWRALEGYATAQFDIAPDGTVRNARIIESGPNAAFENSTLRAITQWQYAPQFDVDGNPAALCDQVVRLDFELADD